MTSAYDKLPTTDREIVMTQSRIDEGMLKFYTELKAKSPPESVSTR